MCLICKKKRQKLNKRFFSPITVTQQYTLIVIFFFANFKLLLFLLLYFERKYRRVIIYLKCEMHDYGVFFSSSIQNIVLYKQFNKLNVFFMQTIFQFNYAANIFPESICVCVCASFQSICARTRTQPFRTSCIL